MRESDFWRSTVYTEFYVDQDLGFSANLYQAILKKNISKTHFNFRLITKIMADVRIRFITNAEYYVISIGGLN